MIIFVNLNKNLIEGCYFLTYAKATHGLLGKTFSLSSLKDLFYNQKMVYNVDLVGAPNALLIIV